MDLLLDALSQNVERILGRASGPLNFRLVMMPIVVTILAIRAHLKDVREGHPLYLGAFFTSPTERRRLFRSGLRDFGKVFVVACVLDCTYQFLVFRQFFPIEMLIIAVACAIVPYFLIRGPITRVVNLLHRRWGGAAAPATAPAQPDGAGREKQESTHE